ncbi:hypothetical protein [Bailinhaonella thermotolerans]|uniref:Uncharacterized protein n=1 Tax=Bailinhaonella thermotolerans TaxID=1070861 RepID=A0A3A4A0C1_9ACTN|nr:hypothetical protein [Bailinhaonella thermotolerans]RJL21262.1 hypothetical protein D5H75_38030 [Bailinhaonella thermotolerans]
MELVFEARRSPDGAVLVRITGVVAAFLCHKASAQEALRPAPAPVVTAGGEEESDPLLHWELDERKGAIARTVQERQADARRTARRVTSAWEAPLRGGDAERYISQAREFTLDPRDAELLAEWCHGLYRAARDAVPTPPGEEPELSDEAVVAAHVACELLAALV